MDTLTDIILLLGSNLGDKRDMLERAVQAIGLQVGQVYRSSGLYETDAWGLEDQPSYYNQVLWVRTSLQPMQVLEATQAIEQQLGRERRIKWGARIIDIDILYHGSQVSEHPRLRLPHPFLHERRFTLVPLAEVAPRWVHPLLGLDSLQLLQQCADPLSVRALQDSPILQPSHTV